MNRAMSSISCCARRATTPAFRAVIELARQNARLTRTAITREVWEAVNESWIHVTDALKRPVREAELPNILEMIKRDSAMVRGAMHNTMLRNDVYNFARIGNFIERADNTARLLDVKYYVLLPSVSFVGSSLDNVQWEAILRSTSAYSVYRWLYPGPHQRAWHHRIPDPRPPFPAQSWLLPIASCATISAICRKIMASRRRRSMLPKNYIPSCRIQLRPKYSKTVCTNFSSISCGQTAKSARLLNRITGLPHDQSNAS